MFPEGKQTGRVMDWEIWDLAESSRSWSWTGGIGLVGRLWFSTYLEWRKQWLELESTKERKWRMVMIGELLGSELEPTSEKSDTVSEWLERVVALRVTISNVQLQSMQPWSCMEDAGLLSSFLALTEPDPQRQGAGSSTSAAQPCTCCSPQSCACFRRTYRDCSSSGSPFLLE